MPKVKDASKHVFCWGGKDHNEFLHFTMFHDIESLLSFDMFRSIFLPSKSLKNLRFHVISSPSANSSTHATLWVRNPDLASVHSIIPMDESHSQKQQQNGPNIFTFCLNLTLYSTLTINYVKICENHPGNLWISEFIFLGQRTFGNLLHQSSRKNLVPLYFCAGLSVVDDTKVNLRKRESPQVNVDKSEDQ